MEKEYAEELKEVFEELKDSPGRLLTECDIKTQHNDKLGWSTVHVEKKMTPKGRVHLFHDEIKKMQSLMDETKIEEGIDVGFYANEEKLKAIIR